MQWTQVPGYCSCNAGSCWGAVESMRAEHFATFGRARRGKAARSRARAEEYALAGSSGRRTCVYVRCEGCSRGAGEVVVSVRSARYSSGPRVGVESLPRRRCARCVHSLSLDGANGAKGEVAAVRLLMFCPLGARRQTPCGFECFRMASGATSLGRVRVCATQPHTRPVAGDAHSRLLVRAAWPLLPRASERSRVQRHTDTHGELVRRGLRETRPAARSRVATAPLCTLRIGQRCTQRARAVSLRPADGSVRTTGRHGPLFWSICG